MDSCSYRRLASDGASSKHQSTMNITEGGATYRVVKTVANGNFNNGPNSTNISENTKTVAGVAFDRTVKFQFSSGDVEFDVLTVNGEDAGCLGSAPADVPGCTDAAACNFNADANLDDASCEYPCRRIRL